MIDLSPSPRAREAMARLDTFVEEVARPIEARVRRDYLDDRQVLDEDGTLHPAMAEARREVQRRAAEAGLYSLHMPAEVGGGGLSLTEMFFVQEALYRRGLGLFLAALAWTDGPTPILLHLDEERRRRYLYPAMRGEKQCVFAVTEAGAGSDVLGIQTTARREGREWVLNGHKYLITNAAYADFAQVFAVTDPGRGKDGITGFLVDRDAPGFRVGKTLRTLMDDGQTAEFFLENCRIPEENVIGQVGQGFYLAMQWINNQRMRRGGMCAGWAQFLLDRCVDHARSRRAFGQPIGKFQGVQWMIVDMLADARSARALSLQCLWEIEQGKPWALRPEADIVQKTCLMKLVNDETLFRVADRAIQVHGAAGLLKEQPLEKIFRIARNLRIPAGTTEIQRATIAKTLGL